MSSRIKLRVRIFPILDISDQSRLPNLPYKICCRLSGQKWICDGANDVSLHYDRSNHRRNISLHLFAPSFQFDLQTEIEHVPRIGKAKTIIRVIMLVEGLNINFHKVVRPFYYRLNDFRQKKWRTMTLEFSNLGARGMDSTVALFNGSHH